VFTKNFYPVGNGNKEEVFRINEPYKMLLEKRMYFSEHFSFRICYYRILSKQPVEKLPVFQYCIDM